MLLRNRSRAVTKPALMGDHSSHSSPKSNHIYSTTMPFSSLFVSPKFRDFTLKCFSGAEALRSPASILDTTRALSPSGNPFSCETTQKRSLWNNIDSKGIGLALVKDDEVVDVNSANKTNGKVLFEKQLRVKIPPLPPPSNLSPFQTCDSDFETRSKDPQNSGICTKDSLHADAVVVNLSEMELSEEYTCIISHGPNPKTTHIFDNCILESYCSLPNKPNSTLVNFLSFCYTCKKHLEQTKDIFIYRGEKAFCSRECRYQEIALDDGSEN
ncbi:hypothetical protein Lal_00011506 [Lupinus albus]|uniref:Putative Zf-FLZ domain-containing protein n=1 Tax=Lupinus albus TaxID=3870 RepID=A0A6A5N871_LUPAL|nr:putative Zf-FLZ domain-containing protein [Lupinus albus]KAF1880448.1 hypothetical protein Lal_00011506 [Lupinus albus]